MDKRKALLCIGISGMAFAGAVTVFGNSMQASGYGVTSVGSEWIEKLFGTGGIITALGLAWPRIQSLLASWGWASKSINIAGDVLQVGRLGFAKQAFDAASTVDEKQKARDLGKAIADALFEEWFAIPAETK